ncbi:MAG: ABC transporter ATP-binding protein [Deltaproteobacteria bacterium]
MNMLSPILEAQNLHVTRAGAHLLDIPSLTLHEGEILSLIGPNGAGKTTLLQTLAYLLRSFQGEIYFKGRKVDSDCPVFEYRRKLAMVFQEPLLFDTTVFNNVATGPRLRRIEKKEIHRQVMENLDRFGIGHLLHRSARTLSGGEAQRASLARAFAIKPELLFLDEPFVSLDPPSRESLVEDLQRVLRETRTTTVLATHDRMEALRLSDRIAVMNGGKILQIGPSDAVMNHPVNEFVASFVGVETILTGNVVKQDGGTFLALVSGREIEAVGAVHLGESVALCIRPENVILSINPYGEVTSARNVFPGKIIRITPMGLFHRVQLDCGFPLVAYVTSHSLENLSLAEGKQVRAFFKATAIHVVRRKERQRE